MSRPRPHGKPHGGKPVGWRTPHGATPHAPRYGVSGEGMLIMRAKWRELADLAQRIARLAKAEPIERFAAADLGALLKRTGPAELPVEGESAKRVRGAFLEACRGLLVAGEARPILAALVEAAAEAVLELLDAQTRKSAEGWQRQFRD